jgi:hypothetical protein
METNPNTSRADLAKLAMVAVVAVGLAALGWAIADDFKRSPGVVPVAAVAESTTTTSTLVAAADVAPTTTEHPSTGSTAQQEPAVLELSALEIDFGDSTDSVDLGVANNGGGAATWGVETSGSGLVVIPSNGQLGPGESIALEVALDRSQIPEGEFNGELAIVWADGRTDVTVAAIHNDNPVIHNPKASPATVVTASGQNCSPTLTTVTARVRDTSELDLVLVRWDNGARTVETQMSLVGEDNYEAQIGPFSVAGSLSAKVVAYDTYGNAGGAAIAVTVNPCS